VDRKVLANRPDIILKNKKERTYLLTGVATLTDGNVIKKEAEKKLKYRSFKYRNSANVEHEVLCHNSNHWGRRNCK
jgi:hypothetical protein